MIVLRFEILRSVHFGARDDRSVRSRPPLMRGMRENRPDTWMTLNRHFIMIIWGGTRDSTTSLTLSGALQSIRESLRIELPTLPDVARPAISSQCTDCVPLSWSCRIRSGAGMTPLSTPTQSGNTDAPRPSSQVTLLRHLQRKADDRTMSHALREWAGVAVAVDTRPDSASDKPPQPVAGSAAAVVERWHAIRRWFLGQPGNYANSIWYQVKCHVERVETAPWADALSQIALRPTAEAGRNEEGADEQLLWQLNRASAIDGDRTRSYSLGSEARLTPPLAAIRSVNTSDAPRVSSGVRTLPEPHISTGRSVNGLADPRRDGSRSRPCTGSGATAGSVSDLQLGFTKRTTERTASSLWRVGRSPAVAYALRSSRSCGQQGHFRHSRRLGSASRVGIAAGCSRIGSRVALS